MRITRNVVTGVTTALASVALVVATTASPALAEVQKNGSEDCSGSGGTVSIRSAATGDVRHFAPVGTLVELFPGVPPDDFVRVSNSGMTSGNWKVTATGWLNDPGTFSFCNPVAPEQVGAAE